MKNWTVEAMRLDTDPEQLFRFSGDAHDAEHARQLAREQARKTHGESCEIRIYNVFWL